MQVIIGHWHIYIVVICKQRPLKLQPFAICCSSLSLNGWRLKRRKVGKSLLNIFRYACLARVDWAFRRWASALPLAIGILLFKTYKTEIATAQFTLHMLAVILVGDKDSTFWTGTSVGSIGSRSNLFSFARGQYV